MTCEVAVMNRRGIALAADSAVTLGDSKKIYHTAEKLFLISPSVPVGIMTFGCADMMDVPWETIIKIYARKLGSGIFSTLEEYAASFLSFIEGSSALFPSEKQAECVKRTVGAVWSGYRSELDDRINESSGMTQAGMKDALSEIIHEDQAHFKRYRRFDGFEASYGSQIAEAHSSDLDDLETAIFEGIKLTVDLRRDLRHIVEFMFGKQWIHPAEQSGVVIAGMGEEEPFPAVLEYCVGTVAGGRLRHVKEESCRVGVDVEASVIPFAQRHTIDTIIAGIHPELMAKNFNEVDRLVARVLGRASKAKGKKQVEQFKEDFERYVAERYDGPFMAAVSGLPRQDLAKMAEALVSLTAFVMRMTADQEETVAEPIDVAILSKGDGFTWVKHKDLIREAGRLAL
jgi:hypothetical protein